MRGHFGRFLMGLAVAVALPLAAADARAESLDAALAKTYLGNPTLNAARAGQRRTETEDDGEQSRHRNADGARHLHVVDAGANHRAQPRAFHQQIKRHAGCQRNRDNRKARSTIMKVWPPANAAIPLMTPAKCVRFV